MDLPFASLSFYEHLPEPQLQKEVSDSLEMGLVMALPWYSNKRAQDFFNNPLPLPFISRERLTQDECIFSLKQCQLTPLRRLKASILRVFTIAIPSFSLFFFAPGSTTNSGSFAR